MAHKIPYNFLRNNWWITTLISLSAAGTVLGVWGFSQQTPHLSNTLYETFRLFFLNFSFKEWEMTWQLQWARWLIFAALMWLTFRLFFEITATQFLKNVSIALFYRNHTIICGVNRIAISLIEKYQHERIIILTHESNRYAQLLKTKGIKTVIGDFTDQNLWKRAKLTKASKLYAVIDNDKMNVEITQSVFSFLEKTNRKEALKCFVIIKDRELKTVLEASSLFRRKTKHFDSTLIHINEMGMEYAIATHIDKMVPISIKTSPRILLIGLTEKTEMALLHLAHCLTMQREPFTFTIVEKSLKKIRSFQKRYHFLHDFAAITIVPEIEHEKEFDSVLVCTDNQIEAMKQADSIRYLFGEKCKDKNIVVFCNEADTFNDVLKEEWEAKKIFPVNLFKQITDYVFALDKNIEERAKETHHFWSALYGQHVDWDEMSAHFKQSNRNQILDNCLRIYIARGQKFEDFYHCLISFSDNEKETLAMMENRRWRIEKLDNGWVYGPRNNVFKRHDCLVPWEQLSPEQHAKDYDAINLMIRLLHNQGKG